ncbi:MAG: hypothetical protein ACFCVA_19150, partial [Gammaproteobacteria bacterium]
SAPKPSAAEHRVRKGMCGRDAGPKPTGTSSRRPLRPGVGCPKGQHNQTAETMTNAPTLSQRVPSDGPEEGLAHRDPPLPVVKPGG